MRPEDAETAAESFRDENSDWIPGVIALAVLVISLSVMVFLCGGCVYKGAKVVEGTDLAVGFTVPGTEAAIQFDALNYLTGFRLGVAENAVLKVKYSVAETNDYFGCIHTRVWKTIDAVVEPCESAEGGDQASGSKDKAKD